MEIDFFYSNLPYETKTSLFVAFRQLETQNCRICIMKCNFE